MCPQIIKGTHTMGTFLQRFSLSNNLQAFQDTVKRFPLCAICCVFAFIFAFLEIHDVSFVKEETLGRLILTFALGFFWFGFMQILSESKKINSVKHIALALVGFVPLLFITFGSTDEFFRLFFIVPALMLLIMVAPYIKLWSSDESFWVFNRHVWFGVAVAYVASMLLAGGASAALAAIKYLFDVKVPHEFFGDIFAFCGFIVGPIYALSFVPSKFEFKDTECHTPPQVNFIVNWIFAPLVITYMAILYAYFIKIGVNWEIPKGQLSYMIVGFLGAGLATYMVAWPLHGKGGKALSLITKYFFPAMIIPVVMQAVSIGMRIEQYGFTEKRYAVAMAVIWFGFIAGGFLLKKLQLKHIPLSLAVLLLLASVGPWSARDVSEASQVGRLESVLEEHGLLVDGQIVGVEKDSKLSRDIQVNISGIADYVFAHKHEFYGYEDKYEFFKVLNFNHISKWARKVGAVDGDTGNFNFHFNRIKNETALDMRNTDFYLPHLYFHSSKTDVTFKLYGDKDIVFSPTSDNKIIARIGGGSEITIDFNGVVKRLIKNSISVDMEREPVIVMGKSGRYEVIMSAYNISGKVVDDKPEITSIAASVFIKLR